MGKRGMWGTSPSRGSSPVGRAGWHLPFPVQPQHPGASLPHPALSEAPFIPLFSGPALWSFLHPLLSIPLYPPLWTRAAPPAKGLGRRADRAKRKLAAPPTTGTLCSPPLHPSLYPGPSLRASAQLLALFAVPRRISLRFCFLPPPPLLALTHHGWGWGLGAVLAVRCSALCSSCELCEPRPAAPGPGSAPRGHVGQSASVTADRDVPAVPTSGPSLLFCVVVFCSYHASILFSLSPPPPFFLLPLFTPL